MNNVKFQLVKNDTVLDADIDEANYADPQYVFSWNRDTPMLRADDYKCPNCNHSLSVDSAGRCKDRECIKCGYSIKLYGYGDLSYDTQDDQDEEQYDLDDDSEDFDKESRHVTFASKDQELNTITRTTEVTAKNINNNKTTAENVEHYSVDIDVYSTAALCSYLSCFVCLFLIALCIAKSRGELYHGKGGGINFSLILCIMFFPYTYLTYVLVDWVTSPNHGC